ncbi:MAG: acyloxyacyl hydrolase [Gemmatimonadaceae bacterium]
MAYHPVAVALCALLAGADAVAQSRALSSGDHFIERTAGFSWYSPAASSLGSINHRRVYLVGLRSERLFATAGPFAIAYTAELIPLAIVERTTGNIEQCSRNANWVTFTCRYDYSARVAVGAGGSPVGAKLYFNRAGKTRVYGSVAGGGLVFSSHVPVHNSRRANFTFEYGGGVEVTARDGRAVMFGYKFHHISNGGTAALNPGLDANVLYVGVIRRRGM